MIFVTVGTHHDPFTRLLDALPSLSHREVVVQHGFGPAPPGVARSSAFMPFPEILDQMEAARVVVTHAGVGSILCARRVGHTPVVVPRMKRFGEHVDDHQFELASALASDGSVVAAWELNRLAEIVDSAPQRRSRADSGARSLQAAVHGALSGWG